MSDNVKDEEISYKDLWESLEKQFTYLTGKKIPWRTRYRAKFGLDQMDTIKSVAESELRRKKETEK